MSNLADSSNFQRTNDWSPRGVSQSARVLSAQERDWIWEIRTPDVRSTTRITESLDEIARQEELEDDWDLDGALPIGTGAIRLASQLVRTVDEIAWQEGLSWHPPEIGPVPDGSIALTWEGSIRQTLIICHPHQSPTIECVTVEEGVPPIRQIVSIAEAARLVLWALRSQ